MQEPDEVFGSAEQIKLQHRAQRLWTLVRHDPRFSFYGRMVSLSEPSDAALEEVSALAHLQGATSCQYLNADSANTFCERLRSMGINTSRYEQCWGGEAALAASRRLLEDHAMPRDLTVGAVNNSTPPALVAEIAELSLSCGVMPVPGSAMRAVSRSGICLVATDQDGRAVATASSYMSHHSSGRRAADAFWGLLATREDRRGEKIALLLGAQAMIWMWETHGARAFTTAIKADNEASMALCGKLAVKRSEWAIVGCIDPEIFTDASITR